MNKPLLLAVAIAVGAALWVASGEFARSAREPASNDETEALATESAPTPSVRVRTLVAEPRAESIAVLGRTEPSRTITVRAETQGTVAAIEAVEGAPVAAGDILARLAEDDRPARLDEAKALVEQRAIELNAAQKLADKGYQTQVRAAEMVALSEEARARLAAIKLDLARTVISAPFDGAIERRDVEIGYFVAVGDAVAYIVDLDPILIVAELTERDVGRIAQGQAATARLVTGATVDGVIRFVGRVADPETHTFRVELEVPNPEGRIVAGMTAELDVPLEPVAAHRVTPAVLTLDEAGVVGVKTVDADGRVAFHPVELVGDNPDGMWITGLPETATVIVVGQEFVTAGQAVTSVPVD
jgi:multidrug efflux system membrane fusion protein